MFAYEDTVYFKGYTELKLNAQVFKVLQNCILYNLGSKISPSSPVQLLITALTATFAWT